jgi:hypothetical protein
MDSKIKTFLSKIGKKGGKKSAKHPKRKALNRDAANTRWRKMHPAPKKIS